MSLKFTTRACRPLFSRLTHTAARSPFRHHVRPTRQFMSSSLRPSNALSSEDIEASNAGSTSTAPRHVNVTIDGKDIQFDPLFLRDSCTCTRCVDPSSKQKVFQTSDIPPEIEGASVTVTNNTVELAWKHDVPGFTSEHRTTHSMEWLRDALNVQEKLHTGVTVDDRVPWNRKTITKDNKWVDFKSYMANDEILFDALSHLNKYGLLFLKNVPELEKSVEDIAGRIGVLKDTFYGRTWDVKSKPNAKNIAYTQHFLGLHMDLLYTSNPPYLQFLHSLRARTPGGESLFSDALHAASALPAEQFNALSKVPVTYHYHNDAQHYHYTRPTFELSSNPSDSSSGPERARMINRINWSPPFQGPFEHSLTPRKQTKSSYGLREYLQASNAFEKLLSSEENLFEYRLEEGDCVVFDNRRVLHARRAFDASKGERWLKGAYVDDDVFFSRLRVLRERFGGDWVADGVERKVPHIR
ncbi:Clavaminate synthase-like protein [Delitschia confertaspora ATCC 74209]|uniref:Clavaminate synthase-like protein n=1 Tax=Delitschia confertaspora ATCC 74209 TaxID=1513339 RepID=A0A9P4JMQ2_9PLEO|nr:Clavaminate synthase-like protein [Delitschia confertaspora ATCC 74209]